MSTQKFTSLVCFFVGAAMFLCALSLGLMPEDKRKKMTVPDEEKWLVTKTAYLDVAIDLEPAGRIVIALFGEVAPNTVNNFAAIAKGNYRNDPKFGYQGTRIHRVIPDFMIQGGDIVNDDGTGGKSIYGPMFADEPFIHSHGGPGFISMANKGKPDTNTSQWFITVQAARYLDGKHTVFGKVIEGMDVVRQINNVPSKENGEVSILITIEDSGLLKHSPYVLPEDLRD